MRIADIIPNYTYPLILGGRRYEMSGQPPDKRIFQMHTLLILRVQFWWYRILIVFLGCFAAAVIGPLALDHPKEILSVLGAALLIFFVSRHLEAGLFLTAIATTPFVPVAFSLKSLAIYPVFLLLLLLSALLAVQRVLCTQRRIWPSFWVVWPMLGLIMMSVISNIMIQVTWTAGVPHEENGNPLIFSEILGIALYCLPLLTVGVTTAVLTGKDQWIERLQHTFLVLGSIAAVIVLADFKRINTDVSSYRYFEPTIGWMDLQALAMLLDLTCILAYTRLLHTEHWLMRFVYGGIMSICLVSVYMSLQISWWLEIALALVVITVVYSRRLFILLSTIMLVCLPLLQGELTNLQSKFQRSGDPYRLIIWQDMLRVWSKQPVLGVGPGNLWTYDQYFTHLPLLLRDFKQSGLGVAHNGYLQTLGELGPVGLLFMLAFLVVLAVACWQLYRRSNTRETVHDRILGLAALGLLFGSALANFTSGDFFWLPSQIGSFAALPQLLLNWIIFGFVIYKDQLWRVSQKTLRTE